MRKNLRHLSALERLAAAALDVRVVQRQAAGARRQCDAAPATRLHRVHRPAEAVLCRKRQRFSALDFELAGGSPDR